jgi:hypothetical protein
LANSWSWAGLAFGALANNGRLLSRAQPLEQFVRAIEEELKRARR